MAHTAQQLGSFFFFGYYISLLGGSRSWSWKWEWGFGLFPFFSFGANYLPSYPSLGHTSHRWVGSRVDGRRCPSFLPGWLPLVVHPSADAAPVHTTDIPCTLPVLFSFVLWPVLFSLGWVGVRYLSVTVPYAPNLTTYVYTWRSELALRSGILGLGVFAIGTQREIPCCSLRFVPHWWWHDRPRDMPPSTRDQTLAWSRCWSLRPEARQLTRRHGASPDLVLAKWQ